MIVYPGDIKEYSLIGEKHLLCNICAEFYVYFSPNYTYYQTKDIMSTLFFRFFARNGNGIIHYFNTFHELLAHMLENLQWCFGRASVVYMSHFAREEVIDDLRDFFRICAKEVWCNEYEKTEQNTIFKAKPAWKQKRIREISEDIQEKQKKIKEIHVSF